MLAIAFSWQPMGWCGSRKEEKTGFDAGCLRLDLNRRRRAANFSQVKVSWDLADKYGMNRVRGLNMESFDADKVGGRICLRHWRAGDRFHLIGAAAAAKLQDIFTNFKVPRSERRRRVVAATCQGEIFLGGGIAHRGRIQAGQDDGAAVELAVAARPRGVRQNSSKIRF